MKATVRANLGYFWSLDLDPGIGPWTQTQKNLDNKKSGPWICTLKTKTLKNLNSEKSGPQKTWVLKNLDHEKRGKRLDAKKRSEDHIV